MEQRFDKGQFRLVFDQYYYPIRNFIYYKLGDADLAEDIAQEVFLKVWDKRDEIILPTIKSYLYAIANNLAINHFKSARKRFEFQLKNKERITSESPEYLMEANEFASQLQEAIKALPESQRVVFLMNRIDELTYNEISYRLNISVKAVEKRMQKALEKLREVVQIKF